MWRHANNGGAFEIKGLHSSWPFAWHFFSCLVYPFPLLSYNASVFQILNEEWFESWRASDNQLHFILESLNYTSLYDLTRGQYRPNAMDFWHWIQQPHIRKAMNLGNRSMSDGVDIYRSMIEDTMQSIKPELAEAIENYKVGRRDSNKFFFFFISSLHGQKLGWPRGVLWSRGRW